MFEQRTWNATTSLQSFRTQHSCNLETIHRTLKVNGALGFLLEKPQTPPFCLRMLHPTSWSPQQKHYSLPRASLPPSPLLLDRSLSLLEAIFKRPET